MRLKLKKKSDLHHHHHHHRLPLSRKNQMCIMFGKMKISGQLLPGKIDRKINKV